MWIWKIIGDNVSTCCELTEANIIQFIKDSKVEAADESSKDKEAVVADDARNVISSEILASLETMRTFISSQNNVPDYIFINIHLLQNYLLWIKTANLVQ